MLVAEPEGSQADAASMPGEPPGIVDAPSVMPAEETRADDSSYPPVDLDTHFFDGQGHQRFSEPPLEDEERDPRMVLKRTPEMARRRASLQKYVKLAVGAAAALCLAALVKVAVTRDASAEGRKAMTGPSAETPLVADVPPMAKEVATAPAAAPAESAAAAPSESAAAAPSESAAAAPAESAAAAPAELDPKAAAKEKSDSRAALERGKVGDAIEAGERSVALDPTDSEAWLILGAAYQEKGDMKNARRSYKACLEQGKHGPKYECAAMPH
jgi:tetratricopeptide (TPR) repeat protein